MKTFRIFMLFLIVSTGMIYANLNDTFLLNNPDNDIYFAGDEAVAQHESTIYAVYYEKQEEAIFVKLAISSNNGTSFEFMTIADEVLLGSWQNNYTMYKPPVILITDNDNIQIAFCSLNDLEDLSQAKLLVANAYTESPNEYIDALDFSVKVVSDYLSGDFSIAMDNYLPVISFFTNTFTNLSSFEYCTDRENLLGGYHAYFWGTDVLYGPVFSNSNIWINQAGGGLNNGWPTFYDYCATAGSFLKYPSGVNLAESGAPMDMIFRGQPVPGWAENYPEIDFNDYTQVIEDAVSPFDPMADIVYVKLDGAEYQAMQGYIEVVDTLEIPVYSWYPHNAETANGAIANGYNWFEESEQIWTNHIPVYDTTWVETSGMVTDDVFYVESELWIEGTVAGMQTWCCSDTVYLTSDICYQSTDLGDSPDDPDNFNYSDYFALLSEKSILIKYKHRDPFANDEIRMDNCDDIYLYGVYAAVGEGDEEIYGDNAPYYDGQFTFECQHPHGSTPSFTALSPYTLQETTYTYVDLHKYIFPASDYLPEQIAGFNIHGNMPPNFLPCGFPYESNDYLMSYPNASNGNPDFEYAVPYGTDYPWYNPVWPESAEDIVFERGSIRLWGGLIQTRRGYVHRSGSDDANHSTNGEYDLENFIFDGDHPSTGYDKDYHYDKRMKYNFHPFGITQFSYNSALAMAYIVPDELAETFYLYTSSIIYDIDSPPNINPKVLSCTINNMVYVVLWTNEGEMRLFKSNEDNMLTEIYLSDVPYGELSDLEAAGNDRLKFVMLINGVHYIYNFIIENNQFSMETSFQNQLSPADLIVASNGKRLFLTLNENEDDFSLYKANALSNDYFPTDWQPNVIDEYFMPENSIVAMDFNEDDSLYIFFNVHRFNMVPLSDLYFSAGYIEGITPVEDENIPEKKTYVMNYPNPFNPGSNGRSGTAKIEFCSSEQINNVEINIYNIKGQLVQSFNLEDCYKTEKSDLYRINWDGKDSGGRTVATGIYSYSVKINDNQTLVKKMIILK